MDFIASWDVRYTVMESDSGYGYSVRWLIHVACNSGMTYFIGKNHNVWDHGDVPGMLTGYKNIERHTAHTIVFHDLTLNNG